MVKKRKNSRLARLAKLTSDSSELLCRINKLIGIQKEPDVERRPQ